ncbi:RluA family pseudouridine synthase [Desulfonatronospira sp. MSAO_Bac3]|uniref:RluA family pseudouridine synthase n=1 Tax=Desulfonatronospira sp. MSAO_Bac3 TaxID=2293857 RepID=UPI00257EA9EC|nr:RluA family pseudouridine synthase [Desulfonatronospira sp. MSAO_Bac3]
MQKQTAQQCLVSATESGQKLFSYLKRRLGREFPGSGLMRLIRTGQVRVNSKRKKPYDRVYAGDTVRIPPHFPETGDDPQRAGELQIVFENPDFTVLDKPAGVPVHSGTSARRDNMVLRLRKHYAGADFSPALVHRLDKETSGLLLAAKNYAWLRRIQAMWKKNLVEKTYLAWVHGSWPSRWVNLEHRLIKTFEKMQPSPEGRPALSRVRSIASSRDKTLVQIRIITGRTHQIRTQLSLSGHPVIGDGKYGKDSGYAEMYLHAYMLAWPGHVFCLPPGWTGDFTTPGDLEKRSGNLNLGEGEGLAVKKTPVIIPGLDSQGEYTFRA